MATIEYDVNMLTTIRIAGARNIVNLHQDGRTRHFGHPTMPEELDNMSDMEEGTTHDPRVPHYRLFQTEGNGNYCLWFIPEKRFKIRMLDGKPICPVCSAPQETRLDLVAHIIGHVSNGICPLCPEEERFLRYQHKLVVIKHIERHVTPLRESRNLDLASSFECPFCFKSFAKALLLRAHMLDFHFRTLEVLTFAENFDVDASDRHSPENHTQRRPISRKI